MPRCKTFGLTLLALLFVAALSAAPAFAASATTPAVGVAAAAVPVTCGLNLPALGQTVKGETCAAQPKSDVPDFFTNSKRLGYCHCGCVNQRVCHTSDDCGGASCDQFISCC
jgi:hypothetical protein